MENGVVSVVMLRIPVARQALGDSKSSFYEKQARGLIPRSVKLGPRAAGLPSNEVNAIIAARIAGRTEEEQRALVDRLHAARQQGVQQ